MAQYPTSLTFQEESGEDPIDDVNIVRAMDGSAKVYGFFTVPKRQFSLSHKFLTVAQKTTLENFYQANRFLTFSFTWVDGVTYTCAFVRRKWIPRLQLWDAQVTLAEV